nr:thermonuclease family protein [uncultured Desulfobulbus sp.]
MIRSASILFCVAAWGIVSLCASVYAYEATAGKVLDGDSFHIHHGRKIETIRLYGIDCPEYRQDGWRQAKKLTSRLIKNQYLEIHPLDVDRYGRTVALVYVQGRLLNAELVAQGWAWFYRRYCHAQPVCRQLDGLERDARAHRKGLWAKTSPMPPWIWKRQTR